MAWTTTELLASIKRRAGMPAAQGTFTDAELLAIANEQMLEWMVPLVRSVREEYWVAAYEIPLQDGVTEYPIPSRASGAVLRDVSVLDATRNVSNVTRVPPGTLDEVDGGFYLEGNSVVMVQDVDGQSWSPWETLRLSFFLRPSVMVATTAVTTATAFNEAAGTVTLASSPTGYSSATLFDIVNGGSPFNVRGFDLGGTFAAGIVTFPGGLPSNVAVGDYVCLPDQTAVPQIPVELHGLLAQKCAIKVLEAKQMLDKLAAAREELDRLSSAAIQMLTPRVEADPVRFVNRSSAYRMRW